MFLILWEFEVKQGEEKAFEKAYGPEGPWVKLFRSDPKYLQTKLLKDPTLSGIYFTLDFWESESDYKLFKKTNQEAYAQIDKTTETLTVRELNLGCFLQREPEQISS
jgi:heme-degrading monooxygenase HmoA